MSSVNRVLLSLESTGTDPAQLRRHMMLLQRNIEAANIKASRVLDTEVKRDPDYETRSDAAMLYTLALTFVTSGGAVALINALRATFSTIHSGKITATFVSSGRTLEISADHLTDNRVHELIETIRRETEADR
jgi:hypothetical protein